MLEGGGRDVGSSELGGAFVLGACDRGTESESGSSSGCSSFGGGSERFESTWSGSSKSSPSADEARSGVEARSGFETRSGRSAWPGSNEHLWVEGGSPEGSSGSSGRRSDTRGA